MVIGRQAFSLGVIAVIAYALKVMESRLQDRDTMLNSPKAVRGYLRLRIADREREVFIVLFLDAQHRRACSNRILRCLVHLRLIGIWSRVGRLGCTIIRSCARRLR